MAGTKIIEGLTEAVEIARLAGEIAAIIQDGTHEGVSSTRIAYRILSRLKLVKFTEPPPRDMGAGG